MRDKIDNPPPATTQAPPASSIFDPRFWEWLTPAFGRYVDIAGGRIAGAQNVALDYINRDVHEWQLRLGFKASDSETIEVPDAGECRKLTVKAASPWEENVWIEPPRDELCYAWRADLAKLTTISATPAAPQHVVGPQRANQPSTELPATVLPKNRGGAPDKWAWERLIPVLKTTKREGQLFQDMAALEEFCRDNVKPTNRKAKRGDDPDLRTVRAAIGRHRLNDHVTFKPPDADVQ